MSDSGASAPRPERSRISPERRQAMALVSKYRTWGVMISAAILALGFLIGILFFFRPATSDVENRQLMEFPAPTVESFLDGGFFSDVSLWYSDTYPLREQMVQADLSMESLYGIMPETRMIGGNRTSDAIPVDTDDGIVDDSATEILSAGRIEAPEARLAAADIENQISDGVYSDGTAAYTLYYFDKTATQNYAYLINDAAKLLDGKAQVYSVVLPTNGGVMLDDELLAQLGVPNQDQAIDYYYGLMNRNVKTVPTFDILHDHRDEYLYFRTDFHWTQLAAYYVYVSFCETKGIEPSSFFDWEEFVFDNYIGEYSGMTDVSGFEPDYVSARKAPGNASVEYWTDDLNLEGSRVDSPIIDDLSEQTDTGGKYNCFIGGNRPLTHINNPDVTDGSSCLVIKDSFGNPFVSTMIENYQDIYAIDFRYTNQKLVDLVEKHGIQDVIFENVLMFAGTDNCARLLSTIIYPDGVSHDDLVDYLGPVLIGENSADDNGGVAAEGNA